MLLFCLIRGHVIVSCIFYSLLNKRMVSEWISLLMQLQCLCLTILEWLALLCKKEIEVTPYFFYCCFFRWSGKLAQYLMLFYWKMITDGESKENLGKQADYVDDDNDYSYYCNYYLKYISVQKKNPPLKTVPFLAKCQDLGTDHNNSNDDSHYCWATKLFMQKQIII